MIKTTVQIRSMMCSMCETKVKEALKKAFPDAKKITVSYKKGVAVVYSAEAVPLPTLQQVLQEIGYDVIGSTEEEDSGRHFIFW